MLLLIDNYDSFTYNLRGYFEMLGVPVNVVRNDSPDLEDVLKSGIDAIVLSPGPKRPSDAGQLMHIVARYYTKVPILGICLGHQAIGEFFGAQLVRSREPMHGRTSVLEVYGHKIFEGVTDFEVMRYHSLVLDEIPESLDVIARARDTLEVMAICHCTLPLTGLQFHPESILTHDGFRILANWVEMCQIQD